MYSGNESAGFPTPWNLNPVAYQNVDTSQVDWAALAQQWIQMKETCPPEQVPPAPPPPPMSFSMPSSGYEGGEAPMEVDNIGLEAPPAPTLAPGQWNNTSSWSNDGWNQWNVPSAGWGWSSSKPTLPAIPPTATTTYGSFHSEDGSYSGYTTSSNTPFNPGYWTPGGEAAAAATVAGVLRPEGVPPPVKPVPDTQKTPHVRIPPPVKQYSHPLHVEAAPSTTESSTDMPALDAAKRRQLPAWIREGLEKMEREKQKQLERERRLKETENKTTAGKHEVNDDPAKSKFDTDGEESNGDASEAEVDGSGQLPKREISSPNNKSRTLQSPPRLQRSQEEVLQEMMLNVRRALTEILLEVTNEEILSVSQEEMARYKASKQATRSGTVAKSQALTSLGGGLGLGIYGDSSASESGSDSEEERKTVQDNYISDFQLQENIRRRRADFERTAREIEAQITEAERTAAQVQEVRGAGGKGVGGNTPPQPLPQATYTNVVKETENRNKEEDFTPPRNDEQHPLRQRSVSETDGSKCDTGNNVHVEVSKYDKTAENISRSDKTYKWSEKSNKDERNISDRSSRDYLSGRNDRSDRDEKSSRSEKTRERNDSTSEKLYHRSNKYTEHSKERKPPKDGRLGKDDTPFDRDRRNIRSDQSAEETNSSRSLKSRLNLISEEINLKNLLNKEQSRGDSSQKENNESHKDLKISQPRETKKEIRSPKSDREETSNSSSDDESTESESSSRDSESRSNSEDSSDSSSHDSASDEGSDNKQTKRHDSDDDSPKKQKLKKFEVDNRKRQKSKDKIDQNNFDVESEVSSKYKYPDRLADRGHDSYEVSRERRREHSSSKRKHSEKSKSRSRSYDKSGYYKSQTGSRDKNNREKEYEKYPIVSPRREKDYYRKERDRSEERSRERNRSYDRSKERSRSFERSKVRERSRNRSRDRYRERSREYRDRRSSRSRSRSKYYKSHRY